MESRLEFGMNNKFIGVVDFYIEVPRNKIEPSLIPPDELKELVQDYITFIYDGHLDKYRVLEHNGKEKDLRNSFSAIIDTAKVKKRVENLFGSLIMNIILTIDGYNQIGFARTLVQYHSNFLTIIQPNYIDDNIKLFLLQIHSCNVYAVNRMLRYRLEKIISNVQLGIKFIKLISPLVWVASNILLLISTSMSITLHVISLISPHAFSNGNDFTNYLLVVIPIFDLLGGSSLLYWILPKALGHMIHHQLRKYFSQEY